MKTEELKAQGLTDEQIQFVMAENGKDVGKYKSEAETAKAQAKTVQEQLTEANKTIESYKGMNIEDIKKSAQEYKEKFEAAEKKSKEELERLKLEYAIDNALTAAGAKNLKAVKATMDLSGVSLDGEHLKGFDPLLEESRKKDSYLYEEKQGAGTGGSGNFGRQQGGSEPESLGLRLAKQQNESLKVVTENPYFK
ncbi:MAG: phage scaffolding protein [Peptostreptococcaceae bacterium]|nr:phage scaffolding protein [Peptostreptococcaceae bacterium]